MCRRCLGTPPLLLLLLLLLLSGTQARPPASGSSAPSRPTSTAAPAARGGVAIAPPPAPACSSVEVSTVVAFSIFVGLFPSESPMCAPRNPGLIEKVSPCRGSRASCRITSTRPARRTQANAVRLAAATRAANSGEGYVTFSFLCNCSRNTGL
eukprot:SAG31_NODE_868_length_11355_cov_4.658582_7_plen_153_part_00